MSDITDVADLVRDIKNEPHFLERKIEWDANRRLVFRERPVVIPGIEMETEYRTPDLLDAADKYTARFIGAPFTVNVSAQGPGPQAEKKAQAMENYDYRLLSRWWSGGLFTGAIHDMCGVTGEGWVHLSLNRSVLPIIPTQDKGEDDEAYLKRAKPILDDFTSGEKPDLFVLEPVSEPETIFYNADRSVIFSCSKVPLAPLQRQYGREGAGGLLGEKGKSKKITPDNGLYNIQTIEGAVNPEGTNSAIHNQTVMLYIVETNEYIYHYVEDEQGKMSALGCYKNVFGGPGFVWIHARKTNHPSSKHSVHPLTHAAMAIAPQVNILGTIVYSGGILGEMQRITLEPMPGPEAANERANNKNLEIELIGNRVVKFPDGYKAVQPNIGVNADTLNAFSSLEQKMMQYGYPPALGQPESVNATSGYQQAVQRDTVASVLEPPLASIATSHTRLLRLVHTGVKTLNVPITFRNFSPTPEVGAVARNVMDEITINPDDIVDVDISVSFDSLTQYARSAKVQEGMMLLEKGLCTEDEFQRDYRGIDDPIRFRRQRLMEKARTLGEEAGLKLAAAQLKRVVEPISMEAMAQSGLTPFVQPSGGSPAGSPATDVGNPGYVPNGAGGSVPVAPPPPSPESAMSMSGANGITG